MNDTNDQNLTGGVTPTPVDPMAQQATPAPTADAGTNPAPVAGIPQPIATDPTTVPEPSAIPVSEPPVGEPPAMATPPPTGTDTGTGGIPPTTPPGVV